MGSLSGCSEKIKKESIGVERFGRVHQLLQHHVDQGLVAGVNALVIQDGELSIMAINLAMALVFISTLLSELVMDVQKLHVIP